MSSRGISSALTATVAPLTEAKISPERISDQIVWLRGQKVLLDSRLAALYGVSTTRLNEQVKRNPGRFPPDFTFRLTNHEFRVLMSQIATSKPRRGGQTKNPLAFTEHGALMAASVLNSGRAIQVSVYVVRAFVRLREVLAVHKDLARKLEDLERKTEALSLEHNRLAAETRAQFKEVIEALRQLMSPPAPSRRPIGFVTDR